VDERVLLIGEHMKGHQPLAELCHQFGVSRKTANKWIARYNHDGPAGLEDRSRAPHNHPNRIAQVSTEALGQARKAHQHWGARKILAWLERMHPELDLPVASTVNAVFAKYGLTRTRQARRRTPPSTDRFADSDEANRIWCSDFKGDIKTGDGKRCYPLTITDTFSRMLLRCVAMSSTTTRRAWPI
jgi:putative transposase